MKLFLLTFFIGLSVYSQSNSNTLSGTVIDDLGQPLLGATVVVGKNLRAAITNENGTYSIKNIPQGKHSVRTSYIGFNTMAKEVSFNGNEANKKRTLNFSLTENIESLEKVTIEGKTAKKKIEEGGFAVAIIDTKDASLRSLSTNDLLDRAVGVRIRQTGGIGSDVEYNLNGMSGSTIGIFLDGLEVSTYGQSFNLNNIPTSMIERIEVYKGVLPSHLTGGYAGGAINVVLKKDVSQNNANIATSYGSFNTSQSDISVTLREKKTGLAFRGSAFYTYTDNSYKTWGYSSTFVTPTQVIERYYRAKRFNNKYKSLGGRFELGFTDKKWADQFFIGYNGSSAYKEIPHGITMSTPYVGRFSETEARVILLNYSKNNFFAKNLALKVNGARSYRRTFLQDTVGIAYNWDGNPREVIQNFETIPLETLLGGQQGEKVMSNTDRKITNIRSNLAYMIADRHRVSLNHKYEATDREDTDLLDTSYGDLATVSTISQNIISMNYEAETFNKKLKTNFLGKYTHNRTSQIIYDIVETDGVNSIVKTDTLSTNSNFGYGGTLSYNVVPDLYILASTESSYVSPSEYQLFGDAESNILANPELTAEKNINYNLGFRLGALEFDKHRISVYANAFWRNGIDKINKQAVDESEIEVEADADIAVTKYVNLGKTQSRGFEAEVIYNYNNRLNASLNFSKFNNVFKQLDENGGQHSLYGMQIPNEPFFTVNANLQYRFNDVFQKKSILNAYYSVGYVGEYYTVWGQPEWSKTPSQMPHDIGVSYRFPSQKWVASIDVKNMFNAEVYDNFNIQKPGRGIYFKLNYTIKNIL
ncbi:TonB-dependent receptor [Lacinutrix mariniflava]|uniref:TonB-dependent receptor n=1 Tax=Lacinutrix mariniflava TaxID=342955 RepID=UPI0006E31C17|nr:TonB-dependent receptor [Lacinutrix mariniflava]